MTRAYQLILDEPSTAACYLQGINEATHGIGDSLLSVLAHRAQDIALDIAARGLYGWPKGRSEAGMG